MELGVRESRSVQECLEELERWRIRRESLRENLRRAEAQVAYYESLLRKMKRRVHPPRMRDLLSALDAPRS